MPNPFDDPIAWRIQQDVKWLLKPKPWKKRKKISKSLRARVFAEKGTDCTYCGAKDVRTLDHVDPVANGGLNAFENLVPSCDPCNSRKKDKLKGWDAR